MKSFTSQKIPLAYNDVWYWQTWITVIAVNQAEYVHNKLVLSPHSLWALLLHNYGFPEQFLEEIDVVWFAMVCYS